jgi:hypothetical protein
VCVCVCLWVCVCMYMCIFTCRSYDIGGIIWEALGELKAKQHQEAAA